MGLIQDIIDACGDCIYGEDERVEWRTVIQNEELRRLLIEHGFDLNNADEIRDMIKHLSKAYRKFKASQVARTKPEVK